MSTKSKAMVITRFPYESSFGGEESHTLRIAEHFRDIGYEVIFLGSCPVLLKAFSERKFRVKKIWGGKMIVTPFQVLLSFFLFPFIRWNLRRHFKALAQENAVKALYCLSFNEKIFLTPLALEMGIPVTWVEHQELRNWFLKNPWTRVYKSSSSRVMIVPISEKNHEVLRSVSAPEKNVHDIVHGVDVKTLGSLSRDTQKNLIVTANRNIPKKGVDDLLAAIDLIGRKDLEVRVITDFLKKENWYQLLSKTDVYILPSRDESETFSLNAAEALAAGCKLVVTSCCGIAKYLHDQHDAFLVQPNDPQDMARGITEALRSSEQIRVSARALAHEKFDEQRMLKSYESLLLRS